MRFVVTSPAFALNLQKKGGDGDGETRVRCGDPALPEREGGFPTYLLTLLSPLSLSLFSLLRPPTYLVGWRPTMLLSYLPVRFATFYATFPTYLRAYACVH